MPAKNLCGIKASHEGETPVERVMTMLGVRSAGVLGSPTE